MGNRLPVPDERMQKTIDQCRLTKKDLKKLYKVFRKYDRDGDYTIDIKEFYRFCGEQQSVFGDGLFELLNMRYTDSMTFSEYTELVVTYCLFGQDEVLKFCYFVIDKDKDGHIDLNELTALVQMLHANNPTTNCWAAIESFGTDNRLIPFEEFVGINDKHPMLLFPAFRMQETMMRRTFGTVWWKEKKVALQKLRDEANTAELAITKKKLEALRQRRERQLKHRMGGFQYYVLFFKRNKVMDQIIAEETVRMDKKKASSGANQGGKLSAVKNPPTKRRPP